MSSKSSPIVVRVEPADGDDGLAPEQPERARDERQGPDRVPPDAPGGKGPDVLEDLEPGSPPAREPDLRDPPVPDGAVVDDPDRAADGDRPGVLEERADGAVERVWGQQAVPVEDAEERRPAAVDARR